eukprot:CAMPEP_0176493804 /NCGR_PEP_ID=MMETSP0200_2-20121128/9740_1 /TAXON_ID=947934 /ORGANISM="Chaetoceros sp., Strain GSL56" /LENGTH=371 /DNA_ID=CAMNT_0017891483 /DNA_START=75 /DNA_END=1187 /DNA_ORIENTATION=-
MISRSNIVVPIGAVLRRRKSLKEYRIFRIFSITIVIVVLAVFPTKSIPLFSLVRQNEDEVLGLETLNFFSLQDFQRAEKESKGVPVVLPPGFDVLDVGASKGVGSINFLPQALKSEFGKYQALEYNPRTLGVDIDPNKVAICRQAGKECLVGNILELSSGGNSVGGVTAWHVLEHMPSCDIAEKIWMRTSELADRFSLFHGPAFDDSHVLSDKGFHRFYENWTGHRCHFNSSMLSRAINSSPHVASAYIIALIHPIETSKSDVILPNGASMNSHHYNSDIHPPKLENVHFLPTVYEEMRACVLYEALGTGNTTITVGLDAALALKDIFKLLGKSQIVSCQAPGTADVYSCMQYLENIMVATLQEAKSMGTW